MYTSKDKLRCVMVVGAWKVEGDIHLLAGSRLTDALNSKSKDFMAVTDAIVSDVAGGHEISRAAFVAVNRENVSVIFPAE